MNQQGVAGGLAGLVALQIAAGVAQPVQAVNFIAQSEEVAPVGKITKRDVSIVTAELKQVEARLAVQKDKVLKIQGALGSAKRALAGLKDERLSIAVLEKPDDFTRDIKSYERRIKRTEKKLAKAEKQAMQAVTVPASPSKSAKYNPGQYLPEERRGDAVMLVKATLAEQQATLVDLQASQVKLEAEGMQAVYAGKLQTLEVKIAAAQKQISATETGLAEAMAKEARLADKLAAVEAELASL